MITPTEYFLAKALKDRIKVSKSYMLRNNIYSKDEKQTVKKSLEISDVIEGYVVRINAILNLFDDKVLQEEKLYHVLDFKKEVNKMVNNVDYDPDMIIKKVELLENTDNNIIKDLDEIIYKKKVTYEGNNNISFICPREKIEEYVYTYRSQKYLNLGGKRFPIKDSINTDGSKVFVVDKKDFLRIEKLSEEEFSKKAEIRELKAHYKEEFGVYFSPTKLGLTPIFESDYINGDKEDNKEFLFDFVVRNGTERLRYYNVLELMKNNYVPVNIVAKQVKAHKAGIVYTNGWFNSRLINEENLSKAIKSDKVFDDPNVVKEYNAKWKEVYKKKLIAPKREK